MSNKVYVLSGKFGKVYKAQMQKNTVAVKVTKKYSSEKAMRDFQNEMSIMSEVAHHNIVRLYGIISEGIWYIYTVYHTHLYAVNIYSFQKGFIHSPNAQFSVIFSFYPLHTNIIHCILGRLSPALVMEYLPHGNLQTFLRVSP